MAWTTPRTWTTGEIVTAAHMNEQVRDNSTFVWTGHGCHLYLSVAAQVTNNTSTTIGDATTPGGTWSEAEDTDGFHASGEFITIPAGLAGVYAVTTQAQWTSNSTGRRELTVQKNSATTICRSNEDACATGAHIHGAHRGGVRLAVGDTIRLRATQVSTITLNMNTGEGESFLSAWRIGG